MNVRLIQSSRPQAGALCFTAALIAAGAVFTHAVARSFQGDCNLILVPGFASPWLAGMPDGSLGCGPGDSAPAQSPILATTVSFSPGDAMTFSATGFACFSPSAGHCSTSPNGTAPGGCLASSCGAKNGISRVCAPWNSLLGVFLGPDAPNLTPAPETLSFTTAQSRDFLELSPELKQVFFIGDGVTSTGETQHFIVPDGATRLFLGTMDGSGWWNNQGEILVCATNVDSKPGSCPADLNGDGVVGVADLLALLACWGTPAPGSDCEDADLTGTGFVGVGDLLALLGAWGACP